MKEIRGRIQSHRRDLKINIIRPLLSAALLVGCGGPAAFAEETIQFSADQLEFFESKVRPLLAENCYKCHSARAKKLKAGLRLDARALVLKGGDSGAAVVPGKPDESLLIKAVRYQSEDLEMPPDGKLVEEKIATIAKWIEMGVPWPEEGEPQVAEQESPASYDWAHLRDAHWAFRPATKAALPQVRDEAWAKNELDRFILAQLQAAGLKPSPPAEPRILVRRIYYNLTGLPPKTEEIEAFVQACKGDSQKAVGEVVDRLLASPHYGEQWGRHWLDVARYADDMPHAWKYRDWVVEALNKDLPYDQFVQKQIAGDLIGDKGAAVATGFFATGPVYNSDGGDPESKAQVAAETLDDRVDTFSRGLLALTISCARCHDHKFDPIPTEDYYSLAGVFNNTKNNDPKTGLHALLESGDGNMKIALRGNPMKRGAEAPRRFLRIVAGADRPKFTEGSGRAELAAAVAAPDNPLTARVIVNRVWQHHFGEGIVRTPSNFGTLGEKPTHPLLLDWMAADLIESGWSLKALHRTIISSAAYQMSSGFEEASFRVDGDNRLLWRMNPRRLGAESWRDTLLAVTGKLDPNIGGEPVADIHSPRRTLYFKVSRIGDKFATDQFLRVFDFPLMRATVAKRPTSIVPQQFLFLMNSPFMFNRAREFAASLEAGAPEDGARIDHAYRLLFAREPSSEEKEAGLAFLQRETPAPQEPPPAPKTIPPEGDLLIADFEGDTYGDWQAAGEAFGSGPARGAISGQMVVSGFRGNSLVNSFLNGDGTTGTLTSPPFDLNRKHLHFLVGGGGHVGATCLNLLVGDKVVRTTTGPNTQAGGSEQLSWASWDLSEFMGQQARIQIVDNHTGGWGHINVDHLFQSDQPLDPNKIPDKDAAKEKSGAKPEPAKPGLTPWQQYAQVLLSSNELMYIR